MVMAQCDGESGLGGAGDEDRPDRPRAPVWLSSRSLVVLRFGSAAVTSCDIGHYALVRGVAKNPSLLAVALVSGVSPFATDTYIAALPAVQADLDTTASAAQLTMTAFLVGFAVGQLVCGPVSDTTGRRRILIVFSAAFVVLSVACAAASNVALLIAARALQGFAGGCGLAVGRAVISDRHTGGDAAVRYGALASIMLLAPVIAPAIGGVILLVRDRRTIFLCLAGLGVVTPAAVLTGIP